MKNFVSVKWLKNRLDDGNVVPVDCRFDLQDPDKGYREYKESHIPGAVYADLEKDLSGEVREHGGRHPLPDLDTFVRFLGSLGIDGTKTVVVYDAQNSAMAARLWWMLNYLGHEKVYVLDGGYPEWLKRDFPVTEEIPVVDEVVFEPAIQKELAADITEVQSKTKNHPNTLLIDARGEERYLGRTEPIDKKAGHIPSAVNHFFMENLNQGKWKSQVELKERFQHYQDKEIINYCGSGVTACVNVLALDEIGKKSRLYVGSWSDWSSYDDNEVETE
ncbi:sulfurtransferase [Alkalihalobacillus sp. AL-G]|nr:sulfurtransferase [Alkalihalobacillus sp. AL-G]WLD95292.1 sulfurtransferase [Alkalihalobacillus sp. AL-G]